MKETSFWQRPIKLVASSPIGDFLLRFNAARVYKLRREILSAGQDGTTEVRDIFAAELVDGLGLALIAAGFAAVVKPEDPFMLAVPAALIGFFLGFVLPGTALAKAADERRQAVTKALPFAIDLLVSAMRSGLDFGAAVRYYVNLGIPGPLTAEFRRMLRETELGTARIAALVNMADRLAIKPFTNFVSAVALGTEMGAPLSDTMEVQGEELRKTRFAIAENKAQRAPSLMILPMAVFIMPAVFIIIIVPVMIQLGNVKN